MTSLTVWFPYTYVLYNISLYKTLNNIIMAKKEEAIKKTKEKVQDKIITITRPGGGETTDNRSTSRRFKNVKL